MRNDKLKFNFGYPRTHDVNESNNFINGWYMTDTTLCDEIIDYSLVAPNRQAGVSWNSDGKVGVNKEIKDSMDCTLNHNVPLCTKYMNWLYKILCEYRKKYDVLESYDFIDIEPVQIQHYPAGGGYPIWHSERLTGQFPQSNRYLVFMTYLNTVQDQGGTAFLYQDLTIKAEKGLTMIWPSDFPFTHRGVISPTEEKFIVTGWISIKE